MKYLGINCLNHDAAMAVVENEKILWAAHAERYSQIKNDQFLNWEIVNEANKYGPFDCVVYYEKPLLKKTRQFYAGQFRYAFDYKELPSIYLKKFNIKIDEYSSHHESHAAGGYYTAPWDDAEIITIDAIGEWETTTIFDCMEKKYSKKYPYSIGLLYSAITKRIGLKPNEEEFITMGMAAFGKPIYKKEIRNLLLKNNHKGVGNILPNAKREDLACSVQAVYEEELIKLVEKTKKENLILSGGCALNCVANSLIKDKNIWIMPNPGDSGSALGCIANIQKKRLIWEGPYLGTEIKGEYPVEKIINELINNKIVGVANGRAEYGPRALGNRSLLADPRGKYIKDEVNNIKKRQKFRPFAPIILEEDVHEYFKMPVKRSPYMQFVGICKYPKEYPAIVHFDQTSRVQTINENDHKGLYDLLLEWKDKTGCPMLLNTSLNIKGQPMVNTRLHADQFEQRYNVKVV